MLTDQSVDGGLPGADAAVNAALDLRVGRQGEEPLDLVQPGRTGRRQVDVPARSPG